jgi:GntR family transcriptional regulator/MocR family aminotransferase
MLPPVLGDPDGRGSVTLDPAHRGEKDQLRDDPPNQSPRTRGLDVLLAVDRRSRTPMGAQLETALRAAVADGRLAPGSALPSTRALASDLGVSRGVVVEAYGQLAAEGVLHVRPGGTTRVAAGAPRAHDGALGGRSVASGGRSAGPDGGPVVSVGGGRTPRSPVALDLLPLSGDLSAFPRRAWSRALGRAIDATPASDLSYGDHRGPERARRVLAQYLRRSRGVVADPATTAFTAGVADGLSALARVLAARGVRRIAVEDPGFPPHRAVLAAAGLEPVPVAVDAEGLRADALDAADVGAVLVTAAHQSPTGYALSDARRDELVRWSRARDGLIVEDDYDGEFRFDGRTVGALQARDPERVAYLGSVSKTLAPALRVGWVVAPERVLHDVAAARGLAAGGAAVLEPVALAELIEHGDYDRHLRSRRRAYARRRGLVVAALGRELPAAAIIGVPAGLHVAVVLPAAVDVTALSAAAWNHGVLAAAFVASFGGRGGAVLPVGYGRIAAPAIPRAVAALAAAVGEVTMRGG